MAGTSAEYRAPVTYQQINPAQTDLTTTTSGVWTNVASSDLTLPGPGVYRIDADMRAFISATSPSNTYIMARLFNVTAISAFANTERIIVQIGDSDPGAATLTDNATAPLTFYFTATVATTVRLQAARVDTSASTILNAAFSSTGSGRSSLSYMKIG